MYENSPAMLHAMDPEGRLVKVNRFMLEALGYTAGEVLGRPMTDLFPPGSRQTIWDAIFESLFETGSVHDLPCQWVKKSGEIIDILLCASAEKDAQGKIIGCLAAALDITTRKKTEDHIQTLAYYDPLTGLPNRTLFQDRLHQALAHAHRDGHHVGLLFIDLDRFKTINDTLGHAVGDLMLKSVARQLRNYIREGDTVARLGGDEFVIISSEFTSNQDPIAFSKRLLEMLAEPIQIDGRELFSTASIGIAIYPDDGQDVTTLLGNADIAMYSAKDQGRNTYRFFSAEMNALAIEKLSLETGLRGALQRGELFLAYQPQLDLRSGRLTGLEALVRWAHPEQGLIPPERFIPVAEETGLIIPLGKWVLHTACSQAKAWQDAGLPLQRVAVNVSARQFKQPDFLETVETVLAETGLEPCCLELELTESIVMDNVQEAIMTLTDLKIRNIHLSIDDFGTGYSSLTYLKHFPIDRIKIAQEFVRDIPKDPDDSAIVEAILAMAASLNLEVIAEGVERRDQLRFLHQRQCNHMQGFYFSRPMIAKDLVTLLSRHLGEGPCCLYEG